MSSLNRMSNSVIMLVNIHFCRWNMKIANCKVCFQTKWVGIELMKMWFANRSKIWTRIQDWTFLMNGIY